MRIKILYIISMLSETELVIAESKLVSLYDVSNLILFEKERK